MAQTVGVIGIGLLGTAIAERLSGAGFDVVGYDVTPERREALARLGGEAVESVAEVGRRCERIVLAVLTSAQVEDVMEGEDGLLAVHASSGLPRIAICVATCEPERVAALAARAADKGIALLDTPVSGTSQQVRQGDGLGLIAGDAEAAKAAEDILSVLYPRRHFVGNAGNASKSKLAINLVLGINRLALAEGLVFAERLGLDPEALLPVMRESAAYSQIMDIKGDKMVSGDYAPQGKISQGLKDLRIMLGEADRCGQELPLGQVLLDVLDACVSQGEADRDNSAVIEEIRRRTRPPAA